MGIEGGSDEVRNTEVENSGASETEQHVEEHERNAESLEANSKIDHEGERRQIDNEPDSQKESNEMVTSLDDNNEIVEDECEGGSDQMGSETDGDPDELDSKVDGNYNKYDEHGENDDSPKNVKEGLTKDEKQKIKEETGWSDEIVDSTRSVEEVEIYKSADLKEEDINGKKCLIRSDIDMEQKDEFGRTNKERMENGNAPITESGETVELHHIGQKQDSPLAELTTQEHRGKGNDTILHDKQKETEIDRSEFAKERMQHWESRAENTQRNGVI